MDIVKIHPDHCSSDAEAKQLYRLIDQVDNRARISLVDSSMFITPVSTVKADCLIPAAKEDINQCVLSFAVTSDHNAYCYLQLLWNSDYQFHLDECPADCLPEHNLSRQQLAGIILNVTHCIEELGEKDVWETYFQDPIQS